MKKYMQSFILVFRQIKSDYMLFAACFAPVFLGIIIKIFVPMINENLIAKGSEIAFSRYFPIFDLFLAIIGPVMLCFAFTMVMLEEIDDKVARYFIVTPLGKVGYLFSRLVLPAFLALILSIAILWFFGVSAVVHHFAIGLAFLGALQAIIVSLMIVAFSSNKLEGMAVTKLGALFLLGIPAPFFITGPTQYIIGVLPSYWMSKTIIDKSPLCIIIGFLISIIWIFLLQKKFVQKVSG